MDPRRVAIYARVSTGNQAKKELSIPEQIEQCKRFCEQRGFVVVETFVDSGFSGSTILSRPGFSRMLELAESKRPPFDTILSRDQARFGRGDQFQSKISSLRKKGVHVTNLEMPVGLGPEGMTFGDRTTERFKSVMDTIQREEVPERVKASQRRAVLTSGLTGNIGTVFGYRSGYSQDRRRSRFVEPDPTTAPVVREMFERYAKGESLYGIAQWLESMQIASPRGGKSWWPATVRNIFTNRVVLGEAIYGRLKSVTNDETEKKRYIKNTEPVTVSQGAFAPLVSEKLFEAVQLRLKGNKTSRTQGGNPNNMVRGIAVCKQCGWRLNYQARKGRFYYVCSFKGKLPKDAHPNCRGTLPESYVQAVVLEYLDRTLCIPKYQELIRESVAAFNRAVTDYKGIDEAELLDARISDLSAQIKRVTDAIATGKGQSTALTDKLLELESERRSAQQKRSAVVEALSAMRPLDEQPILDAARALRAAVKAKDHAVIKRTLGGLVTRIDVDLTRRNNRRVHFNLRSEVDVDHSHLPGVDEYLATLRSDKSARGVKRMQATLPTAQEAANLVYPEFLKFVTDVGGQLELEAFDAPSGRKMSATIDMMVPLTIVPRYDLSNLRQMSQEALAKIGGIVDSP